MGSFYDSNRPIRSKRIWAAPETVTTDRPIADGVPICVHSATARGGPSAFGTLTGAAPIGQSPESSNQKPDIGPNRRHGTANRPR